MSNDEMLAVVRRHLEMENAYRLEETLDTLTPDCIFEDIALGERLEGHAGASSYYQRWWRAFPDLNWSVQRRTFAADCLFSELIIRGTHQGDFFGLAPTSRRIELPLIAVVDFTAGRMAGERMYYDLATIMRQLGAASLPPGLPRMRTAEQ
ncbi:MAG: ester cyclase [Candidatus Binataceae bacterium]